MWYQQCQPEVVTTDRRGSGRHGAAGFAGRAGDKLRSTNAQIEFCCAAR
jgi:hypothetical protein